MAAVITSLHLERAEEALALTVRGFFLSASFGGLILLPPSFNLFVPPFQCGFSRCIRRRSSDNNFVTIIEDFRLVSVSPHPQLFEPSPMDEPRINFRVHDEKQRCDSKTVPSGSPMSPKGFRGRTSRIVKGVAGQCASCPLAQRPWAPWFECGTNMRTERLNRVRAPQRADNAERTKARPPPRDRAFPFRMKCRFAGASFMSG
jgi:hypothetical protein